VQKVLDSHQGSGVRQRTHYHYLKGSLWCARCESRFIVQRAKGNGGVYYYFFCRGRQEKVCDQPYVNVRMLEDAVLAHYATVVFPSEFKTAVRESLDEALARDEGATRSIRERLTASLGALDSKEDNLLDLAADGEMPKEKIKIKIAEIRDERDSIRRELDKLDSELEVGRQVFSLALDLLDQPQELYRQAGPAIRRMLNQTIFAKLKLDGAAVTDDELAAPFDAIAQAGRVYASPTYQRKRPPLAVSGAVFYKSVLADGLTDADLLELALLGDTGSSKPAMVELWGFEPQTSCMPSAGSTSTAVHTCRSASQGVRTSPPGSRQVAVLSCCTPPGARQEYADAAVPPATCIRTPGNSGPKHL
jgi:site-specific DNA recombinase